MNSNKLKYLFITIVLLCVDSRAQTAEITGRVLGNGDVENIHVINQTSNLFTTTNDKGYFRITASYKDTLVFTSVRYIRKIHVVTFRNIQEREMTVFLEENVNVLDEVIVGRILTGKLDSDIENSQTARPIDFYDLGLPGYTGRPLTQSERRLAEARIGQPGTLPILPLINAITGRTKMLKKRVFLEKKSTLIKSIKDRLSEDFFATHSLDSMYHEEFFLFCAEDEDFESRCMSQSDIEILEFLGEKFNAYLSNLNSSRD